ncbi:recombinase family protein [Bacillus salitolerans]|uniref:Recombinase family protein n=1 Tax=Bacillus salitolerans TaxID=1437434 RepID=A0ABW4LTE5_9BACI
MLAKILRPGMKGAFYGRHSTDKQEMLMQQNSVYNLVDKYQCKIVKEYLDSAVSATKTSLLNRKKLQELLSDLETQNFDFVIVYKNDRFARNPMEHQFIRTTMNIYGVAVIESATEALYTETDNIIDQLLQDGLTKFEADNIRQRTRDSHITRAQKGQWTGGQAPFGYRYDKDTQQFSTYPEELEIVKQIFNLYKKGEGFDSIASSLPIEVNKGKSWTKDKVKRIVTNPFYAGFIAWGKYQDGAKGSLKERENWILAKSDYIEPIITMEEWEYCWKLYQQKKQRKIVPKQFKTSFLLKDLVTCKSCKTFLHGKDQRTTGNNGKKYGRKIYLCPSCKLQIETDQLHLVIDKILNDIRLNNPKQIYEGVSTRIHEEMEVLQNEILELKQGKQMYLDQIEKVKDEIRVRLEKQITDQDKKFLDVLTTYRISLNKRIEQVDLQINEKQQQIIENQKVDSNKETWNLILKDAFVERDKINNAELRNLLANLIEELKVDKNLSIEYQLRHNLEKQSLSDQLELQF